jgi:cysteine desulfurase
VERARCQVADLIGAAPEEVYFTSGGTEADNWALKGPPHPSADKRPSVLVSAIEHAAVLESAETLARLGWDMARAPVTAGGQVEPEDVDKRITSGTGIVSVMMANNEVGTLQPVADIAAVCRQRGVVFHVDAVQALGHCRVNVAELGPDLMSLSGHKIHGPKGVGALYIRRGTPMGRWMDGGSQERGLRAGTVNVPAIVGFGAACEVVAATRDVEARRVERLRDRLCARIIERIPDATVTASHSPRLPHFAHVCFRGVEGDAVLAGLDAWGVYASAGAACSARSVATSHVLRAMGIPEEWARGAVRMTLGRDTSEEAVDHTAAALESVLSDLRQG